MKGNFRKLLKKFCLESSVLGLKYFYLYPNKITRVFWAACLIFICYLAYILAASLRARFEQQPTRTTIENQFEQVYGTPYPAITICSPNQVTITAVKHFDRTLIDGNRTIDLEKALVQLLGFYHMTDIDTELLAQMQRLIVLNRYTVPEVMTMLPQTCERFLKYCLLHGKAYPQCRGIFRTVLTAYGPCCAFNSAYYYRSNHRNEKVRNFESYKSSPNVGIGQGLTVVVDYEPEDAVDQSLLFAGSTRVLYTDWTEFPTDDESALVAPHMNSYQSIQATYTYCSTDVRDLAPESRACLFSDERKQPFFQEYHNSDCDLLCLVRAVQRSCNCLLFFVPYLRLQYTCNITSIPCIVDVQLQKKNWVADDCDCPQDCEMRQYSVAESNGNLDGIQYTHNDFLRNIAINRSTSILHFFFPSGVYVKKKVETVMSLTTLSSNLGGVFGLCLGCSVISVLEIIFFIYVTIRNAIRDRVQRERFRRTARIGFYH